MGKKKKFNYVAVLSEELVKLVTEIDPENKTCRWEKEKKPLALSKDCAEQIAFGLNLNLQPAFVLTSFYKLEEQVFIAKGGENGKKTND